MEMEKTSTMDENNTNVSNFDSNNIHATQISTTRSRRLLECVRKRKLMCIACSSLVVILIILAIIIPTTVIKKKKTHLTTSTSSATTEITATAATTATTIITAIGTTTPTPSVTTTTTASSAILTTTTEITAAAATTATTTKTATTTPTSFATTTTTASSATLSTTTSITTPTKVPIVLTSISGSINDIYNTNVGGDSSASSPGFGVGNYVPGYSADNACDRNISTKHLNFGLCTEGNILAICGLNTGFYLELMQGATLVTGLQICTADDFPQRDPLTVSLEGSNQSGMALTLGTSWILIYNGDSGLQPEPDRNTCGMIQSFTNSIHYKSYRFLVSGKRMLSSSVQYSELQLFS